MDFPDVLNDLMMAQQPILSLSNEIFGYELLFREKDSPSHANVSDGNQATNRVLANLCIGITMLESQLQKPFFINMTTGVLLSDAFIPIDPKSIYIEILEDQQLTPEFVEAVETWHKAGYLFALDDYQFSEGYKALLPWVSIVKVDVLHTHPVRFAKQIAELKAMGITLLAEKVENQVMFDVCKDMGFELFQGYYLQRPKLVKGKVVDTATHGAMSLVNALQDADVSIEQISALVSQNPTLSFQLLRILNNPVCGLSKKVDSIKDAVVLIGLKELKKWALLITLTSSSDQPKSIFKILLARGSCCQKICEDKYPELTDAAFTTGLLSGIDTLFGVEKRVILKQIALSNEISSAILSGSGNLGEILKQTLSCEGQKWSRLNKLSDQERQKLNLAFLESIVWASNVINSLK